MFHREPAGAGVKVGDLIKLTWDAKLGSPPDDGGGSEYVGILMDKHIRYDGVRVTELKVMCGPGRFGFFKDCYWDAEVINEDR